MHIRLAGAALAAVSCLGLRSLAAQEPPARLPAVVVNAAPDKPGTRKMAGVVRDTTGFPIDGVEVTIAASHRRATTSTNGGFQSGAPGNLQRGDQPAGLRLQGRRRDRPTGQRPPHHTEMISIVIASA